MGDDGGKDVHEGIGDIIVALDKYYPKMAEVVRGQYGANADAELGLAEKYSPGFAKVQYDTLSKWGDKLASLGRGYSRDEQLGAANTEADIAEGPGRRLANMELELAKQDDPEYFEQRAATSKDLNRLRTLVDPERLTNGETEEVSRGLGRSAYGVASPATSWKGAMAFGDRLAKKRDEYGRIIDRATTAMPGMKSGLDGFKSATQRTTSPNFGLANYTGLQQPGITQSNNIFGQFMQPANAAMQINMNKQASDWDKYNQGLSAVGNTIGTVAKVAAMVGGMCWVARAVYGETDGKWLIFRTWLMNQAPDWFQKLYMTYGERFAVYVKRYPWLKKIVKYFMDKVVNSYVYAY